jgi:hypothetical protein
MNIAEQSVTSPRQSLYVTRLIRAVTQRLTEPSDSQIEPMLEIDEGVRIPK